MYILFSLMLGLGTHAAERARLLPRPIAERVRDVTGGQAIIDVLSACEEEGLRGRTLLAREVYARLFTYGLFTVSAHDLDGAFWKCGRYAFPTDVWGRNDLLDTAAQMYLQLIGDGVDSEEDVVGAGVALIKLVLVYPNLPAIETLGRLISAPSADVRSAARDALESLANYGHPHEVQMRREIDAHLTCARRLERPTLRAWLNGVGLKFSLSSSARR